MKKLLFIFLLVAFAVINLRAEANSNNPDLEKFVYRINNVKSIPIAKISPLIDNEEYSVIKDQCVKDHLQSRWAINDAIRPLEKALLGLNEFSVNVKGLDYSQEVTRERNGIKEYKWIPSDKRSLRNYREEFSRILSSEARVLKSETQPFRSGNQDEVSEFRFLTEFDIRGYQENIKRQDKFQAHVHVVRVEGSWKLEDMRIVSGKTLTSQKDPHFTDKTASIGMSDVPIYLRTEAIRRGGYALSITDYNNDGIKDIFVGLRDGAEMYKGSRDGSYEKVNVGLEDEIYVKTAVFADFDNDGDQDVAINRFTPKEKMKENETPDIDVVLYDNVNGKFEKAESQIPLISPREPMPSAVADFNLDGNLDLYVGYPGLRDFSSIYDISLESDAIVQGLYLSDGKGNFVDTTEYLDYGGLEESKSIFPHGAMAIDHDRDGDSDLIVIDDRGNLSPVYTNLGNGQMVQSAEKIGLGNNGFGMSVAHGDYNNDGLTDFALTNVYLQSIDNIENWCMDEYRTDYSENRDKGLRIFLAQSNGTYIEASNAVGSDNPGDATAGLVFVDYDNDGLQDLYVVNGLWSGTHDGQNLDDFFAVELRDWDLEDFIQPADNMNFMGILSGSEAKVSYELPLKIAPSKEKFSLGGFQRNRLYRNNGDGTFTDVAFFEGVDNLEDGYIVGQADLNDDGAIDLVLRNADPGTELNTYAPVKVLYGKKNDHAGVVLTFEGTKSNKDAIGVYVEAEIDGTKTVRHLVSNSGSMQDERMVHFGLGNNDNINRLTVYWPSGEVQTIENIKSGKHHIIESNLVRVTSK